MNISFFAAAYETKQGLNYFPPDGEIKALFSMKIN